MSSPRRTRRLLVLVVLVLTGCTMGDSPQTSRARSGLLTMALDAPAAVAPAFGDWIVTRHRIPGLGAMGEADASAWHGRRLRLEAGLAAFQSDSCLGPLYRSRLVPVDSLLGAGYGIGAVQVGFSGGEGAMLTLTEIRCDGAAWEFPGGTLMMLPEGRLFTVWEGVFFELRPAPHDAPGRLAAR